MNSVEWRIVGEGKVERGHEDREKAMLSRRQCQMGSLAGVWLGRHICQMIRQVLFNAHNITVIHCSQGNFIS